MPPFVPPEPPVIIGGIEFILSLLTPASTFVKAVKMIIQVVQFIITRGSQTIALVNAVLVSLAAIASGSVGAVASAVENALARAIPVAIGFLISLLGLGGTRSFETVFGTGRNSGTGH